MAGSAVITTSASSAVMKKATDVSASAHPADLVSFMSHLRDRAAAPSGACRLPELPVLRISGSGFRQPARNFNAPVGTPASVGTLIDNRPRVVRRPGERGGKLGITGPPHCDLPFRLLRRIQSHVGNQPVTSCIPAEVNPVIAADRAPWHGCCPAARDGRDHEPDRNGTANRRCPE